ncbi:metallophosphatase family protein [Blastopirellula sp. JC732]|uniref:Metallophosphatase family protein n=1 Tax=Blastopirellula sediminis TaxID=2894196 RepID=A0A9X1SKM7_9BACT|nr:metallophosphoesterase family protein [Blastopirellula sediminis]MCC9606764.1 metallophosphatase family protein [Blastopirellula sediminis]MCC9629939.1 metallophosphatase family protein [Blastopirellula sediminis]
MIAILSDIHGNLEALEAVLADAENQRATRFICLGDVIGYGPDPIACLRHAQRFDVTLTGDWEWGVISPDPQHWLPNLFRRITLLRETILAEPDGERLLTWIAGRSDSHRCDSCLFVHGSPASCRDYLFPEDIYNSQKMDRFSQLADGVCINGHTHLGGVFDRSTSGEWEFASSESLEEKAIPLQSPMILNVGSVGQPRDGDPRALYVLMDKGTFRFRRVEYDYGLTASKLRDGGDDMDGDRLACGR